MLCKCGKIHLCHWLGQQTLNNITKVQDGYIGTANERTFDRYELDQFCQMYLYMPINTDE